MKEIYDLEYWQLDKSVSNTKRFAIVKINLVYPKVKQLTDLKPKERVKKIDSIYREDLTRLIALNLFDTYEITGKKKRPTGVTAKVKFNDLKKLKKVDFVASIWVTSVDHAIFIKAEEPPKEQYYCVKMTGVIEVEGVRLKKQDIEKRFVLIKAWSFNDAYDKVKKQQENYCEPYLNPNGRFVRWRIESYDDCFVTDIGNPAELDNPEGVEVFSALGKRKNKLKTVWDGKP
ncbi:DUF4288 domain-containing protein [Mucilaginibacter ginsenosidivorax]|uniref:DUF4288 domain-containing protein n=1 Tax=Mucilaginibacter ginsenosidivorax TaxID=862126 RepID=A0A5B8VYB6_9SPHI|nr:DUF4288 domain-containing protein [Mucilaginibacter ginsenosidivorax]QEC75278.1 DUF4288 domain-containing protein [Mucilaginibacter ginsenosidivorax]